MIELLIDPFRLPFMATALLAFTALAVAAAPVGVLVHLRGLEFLADGLTHAVFPGLAIGFALAGRPGLLPAALLAALLAGAAIALVTARRPRAADAVVAIVFTAAFSIGVIAVSRGVDAAGQLEALLFGRLLAISPDLLPGLSVSLLLALLLGLAGWRSQVLRAFDPIGARALGVRPLLAELLLGAQLSLLAVVASVTVGSLLAVAVLVLPAAAARLLSTRLGLLPLLAALLAALAGWLGLAANFALSVGGGLPLPGGATVVLALIAVYALCLLFAATRRGRRARRALLGFRASAAVPRTRVPGAPVRGSR